MKKNARKMSLNRETLRHLAGKLPEANGGAVLTTGHVTEATCNVVCETMTCLTRCGCPTFAPNC